MPMFDTADTGIAEYSGDIVQEDAATYDASYNTNEDVAANERDVYNLDDERSAGLIPKQLPTGSNREL